LHMAQLMPLPLTLSCSSKIQIGFTFLVPAHPGSPGKRAVKRVCVLVEQWNEHLAFRNSTSVIPQVFSFVTSGERELTHVFKENSQFNALCGL